MVGWSPPDVLITNGHLADIRRGDDDKSLYLFVNSIIALSVWKINRKLFYKD